MLTTPKSASSSKFLTSLKFKLFQYSSPLTSNIRFLSSSDIFLSSSSPIPFSVIIWNGGNLSCKFLSSTKSANTSLNWLK